MQKMAFVTLRKKHPYFELFWPVFSHIWTEYGEISSMFWGDHTHHLLGSKIKFVLNLLIYFMLIFIIKITITISTIACN